jgi:hypothetical protein
MTPAVENALAKSRDLLARVTFDSDGIMVGPIRPGGNGGLLSNETIKAADQLRRALDRLEQETGK